MYIHIYIYTHIFISIVIVIVILHKCCFMCGIVDACCFTLIVLYVVLCFLLVLGICCLSLKSTPSLESMALIRGTERDSMALGRVDCT